MQYYEIVTQRGYIQKVTQNLSYALTKVLQRIESMQGTNTIIISNITTTKSKKHSLLGVDRLSEIF
jgi:hypothetical protein